MIKALIFDLDGTLIQTEYLKAKAYEIALRSLLQVSVDYKTVLGIYQKVIGFSNEAVSLYLAEEYGLKNEWKELMDLKGKNYLDLLKKKRVNHLHKRIQVIELARRAKKANFALAVSTSATKNEAFVLLNRLDLYDVFPVVVTADDITRPKPDPEIYLHVLEKLHVTNSQCLVFEDTLVGVQSAVKSSMRCIAIPDELTLRHFENQSIIPEQYIVRDINNLYQTVISILIETGSRLL